MERVFRLRRAPTINSLQLFLWFTKRFSKGIQLSTMMLASSALRLGPSWDVILKPSVMWEGQTSSVIWLERVFSSGLNTKWCLLCFSQNSQTRLLAHMRCEKIASTMLVKLVRRKPLAGQTWFLQTKQSTW